MQSIYRVTGTGFSSEIETLSTVMFGGSPCRVTGTGFSSEIETEFLIHEADICIESHGDRLLI